MLKTISLKNKDSELKLSIFGAQIISWKKSGQDIFFDNPLTITDGTKALRTGAPVCFPWFNKGISFAPELKPSHGTARISEWQMLSQDQTTCSLYYQTNSYLNLPLKLTVTYSLQENQLRADFQVENLADKTNQFELALHTYFAASNPQTVKIYGISDNSEYLQPQIPIDQIFKNQTNPVRFEIAERIIEIDNNNFNRTVVWHPGLKHEIKDLEDTDRLAAFLCVESLSDVVSLEPLATWQASLRYKIK